MSKGYIKLEKVYKVFGGRTDSVALSDVSLSIGKGEFVLLTGPNGSGKSTLLKLILAEHVPTSGRVIVDKKIVHEMSEQELSEYRIRKVGMIFQDFGLIDFMTVRQNLEIPMIIANTPKEERQQKVEEVAERLSITHLLDSKVSTLSGGEKQRTSIGTGIINDPEIILADEPTANIDRDGRNEISEFFKEMKERGKTILLVTHETNLFDKYDRFLKFDKGYLIDENGG